eukprot:scaffold774_cov248-Pinguiococcus_pyrenoidosus.AAC.6
MGLENAGRPRVSRTRTYLVEDTRHGCYRDVKATLLRRGFCPWQKRSRRRFGPDFIWRLKEADIEWDALQPRQFVNHFRGFEELGTKAGLSRCMRQQRFARGSPSTCSFYPRSYLLGDPSQTAEFERDFFSTALLGLVQRLQARLAAANGPLEFPLGLVTMMLDMMESELFYAKAKNRGLGLGGRLGWSSLTWTARVPEQPTLAALLLEYHYALLERRPSLTFCCDGKSRNQEVQAWDREGGHLDVKDLCQNVFVDPESCKRLDVRLRGIIGWFRKRFTTESQIQGCKGLWILKCTGASRGIGVRLLHRLDDILKASRSTGWKVVQKYVENALLIPKDIPTIAPTAEAQRYKFDVRVWALVKSWSPLEVKRARQGSASLPKAHGNSSRLRELQVYLYDHVYGRRCSVEYSTAGEDPERNVLRHVTNFALQASTSAANKSKLPAPLQKTDVNYSLKGSGDNSDALLVTQTELVAQLGAYIRERLAPHAELDGERLWTALVFPRLRRVVEETVRAFYCFKCDAVQHRDRSFELLGFDILLDQQLKPWLLEVVRRRRLHALVDLERHLKRVPLTLRVSGSPRKHDKLQNRTSVPGFRTASPPSKTS